jgi:hypothetical protein
MIYIPNVWLKSCPKRLHLPNRREYRLVHDALILADAIERNDGFTQFQQVTGLASQSTNVQFDTLHTFTLILHKL